MEYYLVELVSAVILRSEKVNSSRVTNCKKHRNAAINVALFNKEKNIVTFSLRRFREVGT